MDIKLQHVLCREIVHRLVLSKKQLDPDSKRALPDAFFLRSEKGERALSVDLKSRRNLETSLKSKNKVHGVFSLHVGRIRDVNGSEAVPELKVSLDVVHDPTEDASFPDDLEKNNPAHALIVGVPSKEDDPDAAEFIAGKLADQALRVEFAKSLESSRPPGKTVGGIGTIVFGQNPQNTSEEEFQ